MAKCYVCDACGITIEDPYEAKMKEFYIGCDFEIYGVFPAPRRVKKKVHLCDECYHSLHEIAKKDGNGREVSIIINEGQGKARTSTVAIRYRYKGEEYGTYLTFNKPKLEEEEIMEAGKELLGAYLIGIETLENAVRNSE